MSLSLPIFGGVGAFSSGVTTSTPGYKAATVAGDLLLLCVVNKYPTATPSTPAGWTLLAQATGGHGSAGTNTGTVYATVYWKIADGTESGNTLSVSVPLANCNGASIVTLHPVENAHWLAPTAVTATVTTPGAAWAANAATALGLRFGDMVVAVTGVNATTYSFTLEAVTMPGMTLQNETERVDLGVASGEKARLLISTHEVIGGNQVGLFSYATTASGSDTDAPAGGTVFVVCRLAGSPEVKAPTKAARSLLVVNRTGKPVTGGKYAKFEEQMEAARGTSGFPGQ